MTQGTPPGLIKREIVHQDARTVTIHETWDLTVPGCPMIAFRKFPKFERDELTTGVVVEKSLTHRDYVKYVHEHYNREIEAAIHRFRECGVEIERFSLMHLHDGTTHLCVDGVPRFSCRIGDDDGYNLIRTYDPTTPYVDPRRRR